MKIETGLSEGQVLQRRGANGGKTIVRGKCAESGKVQAAIISGKKVLRGWSKKDVGIAANGGFQVELNNIPVGGPWRLELSCGKSLTVIKEFFVGDVWLLAGQSNMQGRGNLSANLPTHQSVRAFSMRREWRLAREPMHILAESPDACHNGGAQCSAAEGERLRHTEKKGVGPGLFFALKMWRETLVPQGLICTAHGGTSMTQWLDSLYSSALASVRATGQPIAGVLWYQGESDTDAVAVKLYAGRMKKLVAAFRRDLRQPQLPWLMVQIGRVFGLRDDEPWWQIQEQQRLLPRAIKNLSVVTAVDLSLDDDIHISTEGHELLGARLALEANRLVHGANDGPLPRLKKISPPHTPKGGTGAVVDVEFEFVGDGLQSSGEPAGFALVDEQGRDLREIYKITLHRNIARLHLRRVPARAKICYGSSCVAHCNIRDGRGHALPVFAPQNIGVPQAWLPFVTTWKVTPPLASVLPLDKVKIPDMADAGVKTYGDNVFNLDGFINERPRWENKNGIAHFSAQLKLPERMKLKFLLGYDGPFRMWIDGKQFFIDLAGTNPCFPDEQSKALTLSAGTHILHIAMDTNHGNAWGFFLRMVRLDVGKKQILSGKYKKPIYQIWCGERESNPRY